MRGATHVVLGTTAACAVARAAGGLPGGEGIVLLTAATVGSLLPDIDTPFNSLGMRKVGRILQWLVGHRTVTHSLIGWAAASALAAALAFAVSRMDTMLPGRWWVLALGVSGGYAVHLLADAATKTGVPLLYPVRDGRTLKRFHLLPKILRIRTGSFIEMIIGALALLPLAWGLWPILAALTG